VINSEVKVYKEIKSIRREEKMKNKLVNNTFKRSEKIKEKAKRMSEKLKYYLF